MVELRANTSVIVVIGPFADPATGLPVTGADIDQADVQLSKNGAAFAQQNTATSNAAHMVGGCFPITLSTTDTNTVGVMTLVVNISADANTPMVVRHDYMVLNEYEWDKKYTAVGWGLQGIIDFGTAQSATATTLVFRSAFDGKADDLLIGATLSVYSSTNGTWQSRTITDWVTATDTATVDTWTATPTGTILYVCYFSPPGVTALASLPSVNVESINNVQITGDGSATPFNV